jgi:hypothetical protein
MFKQDSLLALTSSQAVSTEVGRVKLIGVFVAERALSQAELKAFYEQKFLLSYDFSGLPDFENMEDIELFTKYIAVELKKKAAIIVDQQLYNEALYNLSTQDEVLTYLFENGQKLEIKPEGRLKSPIFGRIFRA